METIIVLFNIPGLTTGQYDQVWTQLRNAGQAPPQGLQHHVGGQQNNNWLVVDVWESAEAFQKFGETLMPILAKIGVAPDGAQPVIMKLHNEYDSAVAGAAHQ